MLRPTTSPNAHFFVGEVPASGDIRSRWVGGTALSIVVHILGLGALLYTATHAAQVATIVNTAANRAMIFLPEKGPERGGGGRSAAPEPPARVELVAARPVDAITPIPKPADVPTPDIIVAMQTPLASQTLPGTLSPLDVPGTGATTGGTGTGIDGGRGNGVRPGDGGNQGGGAHLIGNGVTPPVLFHEVRPNYTAEAMRAKLQGAIEMEAVVQADGTVDPKSIRITRSLDSTFGLDEQAAIAVRQWRFHPGTLHGQAVAVIVNIELTFTLR
jgi:periplasmic protein TonB